MNDTCSWLTGWLRQARGSQRAELPPDHIIAHIADCPRCRGTLTLLLAHIWGPWPTVADQPCETVEAQLPAFIDYEIAHGLAAAAKTFPDIWWHTLVCPRCSALYTMTRELASFHVDHVALPVAPVRPPLLPKMQIDIPAGMLSQLLRANRRLGVAWGEDAVDMVIAEEENEIGVVQLSLRHKQPAGIALIVRVDPPIEGSVTLSIAGIAFHQTLDTQGCAVFEQPTEQVLDLNPHTSLLFVIEPTTA